jgi:TIR domain
MRPGIFISHSSRDDPFAARLRACLVTALEAGGYAPWLDEVRLGAGDRWRCLIYRHLLHCRGAVLLLSPAALESPWVRKEATILSFRGSTRARLRLVPVLLGGVTPNQVEAAFPALYLSEYEFVTVPPGAAPAEAAEEIAAGFTGLGGDVSDDMAAWTTRVRVMLRPAPAEILQLAAAHLLTDQEPDLDDSAELMAHALLHGPTVGVYKALRELADTGFVDMVRFVRQVAPAYVREDLAAPLRAALRSEQAQVVAVNGAWPDTGALFTRRACCCSTSVIAVHVGLVGTERTVDSVAEATRDAVGREFNSEEPADLESLRSRGLQLVIVLSTGPIAVRTLRRIVDRLRQDWAAPVVVVLTGRMPGHGGEAVASRRIDLEDGYERRFRDHINGLRALPGTAAG